MPDAEHPEAPGPEEPQGSAAAGGSGADEDAAELHEAGADQDAADQGTAPEKAVHPPPLRRLPGWAVVARKELADHLNSVRFTILMLIMGLALIASVYAAAGGIRKFAEDASGVPALFLALFTAAPEQIPPFFTLVGLLGPLLGIAFGFDAVNGERSQGTLPRLLAQPIYRDDVINGKFVAGLAVIALSLGGLIAMVVGLGLLQLGVVPSLAEVMRLAVFYVVTVVYIGFWLALATLFSVILRRAATSALAAIAAWLVVSLFASLLIGVLTDTFAPLPDNPTFAEQLDNATFQQNLARAFPGTLYSEATIVLLNPEQRTLDALGSLLLQTEPRAVPAPLSVDQSLLLVWPQVTVLVALSIVCFAVAYIYFMRQEVRA